MICREVIAGLMEWAYHEEDEDGVKTTAYAYYIINNFFGDYSGKVAELRKNTLY